MKQDQIVIYQTEDGKTQIDVRLENETVWLTQAQMAELFQKDRTVITRHINNVFKEGELEKEVVCAKFAHTTQHGAIEGKQQTKETVLYNLDVIISVGYRVHSKRGTVSVYGLGKSLKIISLRVMPLMSAYAMSKLESCVNWLACLDVPYKIRK